MCSFTDFQGRKLEKQVEKLRRRSAQQAEDIERLRSENSEMELLRVCVQADSAHSVSNCVSCSLPRGDVGSRRSAYLD